MISALYVIVFCPYFNWHSCATNIECHSVCGGMSSYHVCRVTRTTQCLKAISEGRTVAHVWQIESKSCILPPPLFISEFQSQGRHQVIYSCFSAFFEALIVSRECLWIHHCMCLNMSLELS
jgi:hypothetical protein